MKNSLIVLGMFIISSCQVQNPSGNDTPSPSKSGQQLSELIEEVQGLRGKPFPFDSLAPEKDARLSDVSGENEKRWYEFILEKKEELDELNQAELSDDEMISFGIINYLMEDDLARYEDERYLIPLNAEGGFHTSFGFIPSGTYLNSQKDVDNYLIKLNGFATYVDQHIVLMREGLQKGKTLASEILEGFEVTVEAYIVSDPKESVFYRPFDRMGRTVQNEEEAKRQGEEAIRNSVTPGYERLLDFMKSEYIPGARKTLGVAAMPGGKELYEQRVRHFTTLNLSPDEIYRIGEKEVARILGQMQEVLDEVGFKGSIKEFIQYLRTDPRFYAKTAEDLLEFASRVSKRIDGKLPAYFKKLPRQPYGVEPVPAEIAPRYTGGRYKPGRFEKGESGTYWVNTYKLDSRPLYLIPSLTLHEAVPGHHLQEGLTSELENLPEFRRKLYISAFGEGWALYCEYLGDEMGIYRTPYEHFGKLSYEMWRACRLVVDVGIHYKGWTRDQAVSYIADRTALSLHEVNTEINRYIGWPGQALSYKMGEIMIRELRKKAETELGGQFDLRDFHDLLLSQGTVPLFVLEDLVDKHIEMVKKDSES